MARVERRAFHDAGGPEPGRRPVEAGRAGLDQQQVEMRRRQHGYRHCYRQRRRPAPAAKCQRGQGQCCRDRQRPQSQHHLAAEPGILAHRRQAEALAERPDRLHVHAGRQARQHAGGQQHQHAEAALHRDAGNKPAFGPVRLVADHDGAEQGGREAVAVHPGEAQQHAEQDQLGAHDPAIGGADQPGYGAHQDKGLVAGRRRHQPDIPLPRHRERPRRGGARARRRDPGRKQQRQEAAEPGTPRQKMNSVHDRQQAKRARHRHAVPVPGLEQQHDRGHGQRQALPEQPAACQQEQGGHEPGALDKQQVAERGRARHHRQRRPPLRDGVGAGHLFRFHRQPGGPGQQGGEEAGPRQRQEPPVQRRCRLGRHPVARAGQHAHGEQQGAERGEQQEVERAANRRERHPAGHRERGQDKRGQRPRQGHGATVKLKLPCVRWVSTDIACQLTR